MLDSITVRLYDDKTVTLPLPYFAMNEGQGWTEYYCITGYTGNIKVTLWRDHLPTIEEVQARQMSGFSAHCSESMFIKGYETAQLKTGEAFYSACKSVKPAAPFLTEKA